jgi:cyclopropane-fatty-acyl-phospholipid synthase
MTTTNFLSDIQKYVPIAEDITEKNSFAYKATRLVASALNLVQMGFAEAYINGLEIPDSVLCGIFDRSMSILFKYFPSLLAPYEWVLQESDHLAESSKELMKVQYDLPQAMLNQMLGDGNLIYPKYSMGLWENGAIDLEQAQMHMLDQVIERLGIVDGDRILDFGCGWGCVANYILSKFPNVQFTGLNLSHQQCEYMRGKINDPQSFLSGGRFTLHEGDFNDAQFAEKFDKIISIGFFCHVGNLTDAFQKLSSFLKVDGKAFIHIFTVRTPNNISSGFTHKYIFPHGRYWNHDAIPRCNRDLKTINRWYISGKNYQKTFAAWLQRFDDSQEAVKSLDYGINYAKFRRIWRFYLMFLGTAIGSCDGQYNGNGQYLMVHADQQ